MPNKSKNQEENKMNRIFLALLINLFILSSLVLAQESSSSACDAETEEKNKATIRKFYEKLWFSNNPEVADEVFASEYVAHDIGDRKNSKETPEVQKEVAASLWDNGELSGSIDYQIAECDLVATRWQGTFKPSTWWMKWMGGRDTIPIINVVRFENGKVVEIWNHRHDIDTFQGNIPFVKGLLVGLIPSIIFLILSFILWRKLSRSKAKV